MPFRQHFLSRKRQHSHFKRSQENHDNKKKCDKNTAFQTSWFCYILLCRGHRHHRRFRLRSGAFKTDVIIIKTHKFCKIRHLFHGDIEFPEFCCSSVHISDEILWKCEFCIIFPWKTLNPITYCNYLLDKKRDLNFCSHISQITPLDNDRWIFERYSFKSLS